MVYLSDLATSLAAQIDSAPTYGEKEDLIKQLAEVRQAIGASGGGTPTDVAGGINASADIDTIIARLTTISAQVPTPVELADNQKDIHGQALGVSRITQVTAKFFQQAPVHFLNITTSGNGTATGPTLGLAVFATGAPAVASSLLAQTPTTVMYATAYEAWASQAAVFTTPTSATSFQRLGIYDAVNGYFFGFSGLTFGLTVRSNSVDTFIARTSWNTDTLSGSAGSKFTSGGVPVSLNPTNINMYRVRYGWYGAATARLEIYSPDGDWVLVHVVRTANTVSTVNITNPDLPMTVEISKPASDSTNVRILCGGWAAGITTPAGTPLLSGQGSIAALNANVSIPTTGLGGLAFSVTGTWVGTLSFQHSLDGLAWITDNALNNVTEGFSTATTLNGSFTSAVGSFKFYRVTATAWTSGSASIVYNGSATSNLVVAQIPQLQSGFRSNPIVTRAANTNGYFANDVYGASFELTNIGSSGGFIVLTGVRITFNFAALPVGMGGFVLFLYTVIPPSLVADNGAFSIPAGDRASLITPLGIDLGSATLGLGGGTVVLDAPDINRQLRLAAGSTSLFGYLVTRAAFTPAAVSETASLVAIALGV